MARRAASRSDSRGATPAPRAAAGPRDAAAPRVGILMGSASDIPVMEHAREVLKEFGIVSELLVASAHRNPEKVRDYAQTAESRGIRVLIGGAGMAAHLAGALAAQSLLPVIGVPLDGSPLGGLDSLLSTAQMPPGVPVATVAIGAAGAKNAGHLAARIIALEDPAVAKRLGEFRDRQAGR
jgi:phosphoribosylaminoimidazole carboxylase PurE protein